MSCNLSVSESLLLWREVACLQLEALRQVSVGFAVGWQLASVRRYAVVGLSSCPFDSSSQDGLDDLWCPQASC